MGKISNLLHFSGIGIFGIDTDKFSTFLLSVVSGRAPPLAAGSFTVHCKQEKSRRGAEREGQRLGVHSAHCTTISHFIYGTETQNG